MYSTDYKVGDLVHLSPADVVHTWTGENCDAGPVESTRFGLAVEDQVTALIIEIKEEPDVYGEITLLVGLQKCYMTYNGSFNRPELKVINEGRIA